MFRTALIRCNLKSISSQFRFLKCSSNGIRFNKFNDNDNLSNDRKVAYQRNLNNDLDDFGTFRSKSYNRQETSQRFNVNEEDEEDLDEYQSDDNDDLNELRDKNKKLNQIEVDEDLMNDELILNVNNCDNISALFKTIKDEIDGLTGKQLEFIFIKLNELCSESKKNKDDPERGYKELIRIASTSSIFYRLLMRPFRIFHEVDFSIFPIMLRTFQSYNVDPDSKVVARTLGLINSKRSSLNLEELQQCLITLNLYTRNEYAPPSLTRLFFYLLEEAKRQITNTNLENQNSETIIRLIFVLNIALSKDKNENNNIFRLIATLLNQLNSKDLKLEFKSAVSLLKSLKVFYIASKKNRRDYDRESENRPFRIPDSYDKLVDKCNLIIYEDLSIDGSTEKFDFFLHMLHSNLDSSILKFTNFYEYKLLSTLSYHLTNNGLNGRNEFFVLNMAANYAKFNTYDAKLMKLLYDHLFENEKFKRRSNSVTLFCLFCKVDFPFLDLQKLAETIFENPKKYSSELMFKDSLLQVLTTLIINDIHHDELYKIIRNQLDRVDRSFYRSIDKSLVRMCFLANAFLDSYSTLEPNMKRFVYHMMKKIINNIRLTGKLTKIDYNYFEVNPKLQHSAYLSNDIYVTVFGIYDKSIGGLISLENYTDLFTKIDTIPLTADQQLVVFVVNPMLEGNLENYEFLKTKPLKKIFNSLNIKVLHVIPDDVKHLLVEEKVKFFERAILDSYRTDDD